MKSNRFKPKINFPKFLISSLLIVLFSFKGGAQNSEPESLSKMNFYLDVGGGYFTGLASLNFEAKFHSGKNLTWYGRIGFGGGGSGDNGTGGLAAITMLTGKRSNHFEINGGVFIANYSDVPSEYFALPILDLGYRYQKPSGGIIFRAKAGILGIGLGIGYAF